jgi:hypothetical protein
VHIDGGSRATVATSDGYAARLSLPLRASRFGIKGLPVDHQSESSADETVCAREEDAGGPRIWGLTMICLARMIG